MYLLVFTPRNPVYADRNEKYETWETSSLLSSDDVGTKEDFLSTYSGFPENLFF